MAAAAASLPAFAGKLETEHCPSNSSVRPLQRRAMHRLGAPRECCLAGRIGSVLQRRGNGVSSSGGPSGVGAGQWNHRLRRSRRRSVGLDWSSGHGFGCRRCRRLRIGSRCRCRGRLVARKFGHRGHQVRRRTQKRIGLTGRGPGSTRRCRGHRRLRHGRTDGRIDRGLSQWHRDCAGQDRRGRLIFGHGETIRPGAGCETEAGPPSGAGAARGQNSHWLLTALRPRASTVVRA